MATVKFFLQSKKNPSGIYVRLRAGRSVDAKAKTKYVINPTLWSSKKGQLKNTKDESLKKLDSELNKLRSSIINAYNSSVGNTDINSQWLKTVLDPKDAVNIPIYLTKYFEFYRENKKHQNTKETYKKLSYVENFIEKYETKFNRKILISEVNENFMVEFLQLNLDNGYQKNYISKIFDFIKTICYDAETNGLKIDSKLRKLRIKRSSVPIIYLNQEEILAIENLSLKNEALDNARDWLIISCETAQRISDFKNFHSKDIRYQVNNKNQKVPILDIIQKKTKANLPLPLSRKVISIIEKRNGQFPQVISDQKYNKHIKEIAKKAGLIEEVYGGLQDPIKKRKVYKKYPKWKLITSHIGRKSFATNNFGKIPNVLIMAMTGHKTETEFLKYIGKSENSKALQLYDYLK